jgi:hypothetical protein
MLRNLDAPRLREALSRALASDRRELPTPSEAEALETSERASEATETSTRARSAS